MENTENMELQYDIIEYTKLLEKEREKYDKISQSIGLIQREILKMINEGTIANKKLDAIVLRAMEILNLTDFKEEILMILNIPTFHLDEEDYKTKRNR